MPYVSQKDRSDLDPLIAALNGKIAELCLRHQSGGPDKVEDAALGYLGYVAMNVLRESGLNAAEQYQGKRAMRYWLVVDAAGIAVNIAFELFDRVLAEEDKVMVLSILLDRKADAYEVPADATELDSEIGPLLQQIAVNAGVEGYNYDGAYCGLVNYALTELGPRVVKSVRDAQDTRFDLLDVEILIEFWFEVVRELYRSDARPYEDLQREKNGDVRVYGEIHEWLRA